MPPSVEGALPSTYRLKLEFTNRKQMSFGTTSSNMHGVGLPTMSSWAVFGLLVRMRCCSRDSDVVGPGAAADALLMGMLAPGRSPGAADATA